MELDDLISTIKETDPDGWNFFVAFMAYVKAVEQGVESLTPDEFEMLAKAGLILDATE